jgi:hypothetical protein
VSQQTSSLLVRRDKEEEPIPEKDKKIIRLHPNVKDELDDLVEYKGETYNHIVKRLIRFYKQHK